MKFKRTTSIYLLLSFLLTQPSVIPASAMVESSPEFSSLNAKEIRISEDLGKIQEEFRGKSKEKIVIIQDAHAIPEAQKSIRRLIGFFQKKYGVKLIGLEGAGAQLDPQIFRSFPDSKKLAEVFRE